MNIIQNEFFNSQFEKLRKRFPKILSDFDIFVKNIEIEPFSKLWNWLYKYRIKNSSIPTWKRSGFRIIILHLDDNNIIIPIFIYSKNEIENKSSKEIINAKNIILKELMSKKNKS